MSLGVPSSLLAEGRQPSGAAGRFVNDAAPGGLRRSARYDAAPEGWRPSAGMGAAPLQLRRRSLLSVGSLGLGTAAMAMLGGDVKAADRPPPARRAIYLFMSGGPSQLDLWDPKPLLQRFAGESLPPSIRSGQRLTTMTAGQAHLPLVPGGFAFKPAGRCGIPVSELLPHLAEQVDHLAIVRSLVTESINHDPAITAACTGDPLPGKASLGSWLSYGLGSAADDLPAFVVMTAAWTGRPEAQPLYSRLWGSGFLPGRHQGVPIGGGNQAAMPLADPPGIDPAVRRAMIDAIAEFNADAHRRLRDPEILTRTRQYELAFEMQRSVPELTDISNEPRHVLDLYGPEVHRPGTFAHCCLLARRMAERGVRLSQIFHRGWDQHEDLPRQLRNQCRDIDRPTAGLLTDLKQRGMLDDTLVVWGGEFGRTPYCQGKVIGGNYGRDHHPRAFTGWMAGGGVAGGVVHGRTDDFGYNVEADPVSVADWNATILDRLGLDHRSLLYPAAGLEERLTGPGEARVVSEILT